MTSVVDQEARDLAKEAVHEGKLIGQKVDHMAEAVRQAREETNLFFAEQRAAIQNLADKDAQRAARVHDRIDDLAQELSDEKDARHSQIAQLKEDLQTFIRNVLLKILSWAVGIITAAGVSAWAYITKGGPS